MHKVQGVIGHECVNDTQIEAFDVMEGLDGIISGALQDKIWEMIWKRWCAYEDFCNS